MKILEFANSVDPDEVAHDEPPHLIYTVCLLVIKFVIRYSLAITFFEFIFAKVNFCVQALYNETSFPL